MSLSDPNFSDLSDFFTDLGSQEHPSAVQGYVSGLLAAGVPLHKANGPSLIGQLLGQPNLDEQQLQRFEQWIQALHQGLQDLELAYQPLLPDDDNPLPQRLLALAIWAGNFMSGFGMGLGQQSLSSLQQEMLRDLDAIANLDADIEDGQSEEDYLIVSEHARLIALQLAIGVDEQSSPLAPSNLSRH